MAYIIVNKKVNAKFFTANRGNLDSAGSAETGTLVKESEINNNCNDFYIVS